MHNPRRIWTLALGLLTGMVGDVPAAEPSDLAGEPLSIQAFWETGVLSKGLYDAGASEAEIRKFDWVDHVGAFLSKEGLVGERLFLSGGLGGVFEFRKPEVVSAGFIGHQRKDFFAGPTRAEAQYRLGDPRHPWLTLGTGMFPFKYNPDAWDLGEYLFRSLPYPTVTTTGGYVLINSASANLQGFKGALSLGRFRADVLLTTETSLAPLYDWSLAGLARHSFGDGLLDLGAGVLLKRILPMRPSKTARKDVENGYFRHGDRTYSGGASYYEKKAKFYEQVGNTAAAAQASQDYALVDSLTRLDPSDPGAPRLQYYSAAGTLLMARASLNLKKVFGSGNLEADEFRLYAEAALLGVKNYPVFYEKRAERMPVMVGFNIPTWGLLDLLAVQAEHMKSPWLNNTAQIAQRNHNVPYFPNVTDRLLSESDYNDLAGKDDWKWSLLIRKGLGRNVSLWAQAASNHLRLTSSRYYYGPQFDHNEVTPTLDYWYGMVQLSWGI